MMIEAVISMMRYLSSRKDDDVVDRMNYLYTPNMLLAFSVLISFKQFGGKPIECVLPSKFPGSWEQYTENYCWSQDSYFVRPDVDVELIHTSERYSEARRLSYYQWVPFLFLLQAACFRLPSLLWRCISMNSGIRVHEIVDRACDSQNLEETTRKKNLDVLTTHISKALHFQRRMTRRNVLIHKTVKLLNLRYKACFISYMYLVTKLCYLVNVWVQFYSMNWFLHTDKYSWYGYNVVLDILGGKQWETSGFFPRVSICDFSIRQVANIQKYSVQCVLVINIFNEKIFILLWFWYIILAFCTAVSFIYWAVIISMSYFGFNFIQSNLELSELEINSRDEKKRLSQFVNDYLKMDGIFVLRMVSLHAGVIFGTELVAELYKSYHNIEDPGTPYPVPSYYESNLQVAGLRRRKKNSKEGYESDDESGAVTALIPMTSAGNDGKDDETEDEKTKGSSPETDDTKNGNTYV
uniref:Innexin n=1 Tax=Panagrolaimus sp. JU765 TaxID=591449 RepID=A0AC34Q5F8_9BILA